MKNLLQVKHLPSFGEKYAHRLKPGYLWRHWGFYSRLLKHRLLHPQIKTEGFVRFPADLFVVVTPSAQVQIGDKSEFDRGFTLSCTGRITIGPRTFFGHRSTLAAIEVITIGADCQIAEMVSIRDHDHRSDQLDIPIREQGLVSAPVVIGDNVWIGSKATILKGVTLGSHSIIGAGAVVTHDIPAYGIAVGVPARVVRDRRDYHE